MSATTVLTDKLFAQLMLIQCLFCKTIRLWKCTIKTALNINQEKAQNGEPALVCQLRSMFGK